MSYTQHQIWCQSQGNILHCLFMGKLCVHASTIRDKKMHIHTCNVVFCLGNVNCCLYGRSGRWFEEWLHFIQSSYLLYSDSSDAPWCTLMVTDNFPVNFSGITWYSCCHWPSLFILLNKFMIIQIKVWLMSQSEEFWSLQKTATFCRSNWFTVEAIYLNTPKHLNTFFHNSIYFMLPYTSLSQQSIYFISIRDHFITVAKKLSPKTTKERVNELEALSTNISKSTIKRALHRQGLKGCCARKKPLLQDWHKKARVRFADEHQDKDIAFWRRVFWTDETRIKLFGHNDQRYVWRKKGEAFHPNSIIPTVKHGGDSIMLWGSFARNGTGALQKTDGIMRKEDYLTRHQLEIWSSIVIRSTILSIRSKLWQNGSQTTN